MISIKDNSMSARKGEKICQSKPTLRYYQARNFVLHQYNAMYIEVPKVACSSINLACADLIKLDIDDSGIHHPNNKNKIPRVPKDEISKQLINYYKFAFVRNPWDRVVSCYCEKIRNDPNFNNRSFQDGVSSALARYRGFKAGMSFESFVEKICEIPDENADAHFLSQHLFVIDDNGVVFTDYIGRFESIQEDFQYVCNKINSKKTQLSHANKSQSRHSKNYRDFYNEYSMKMVQNRYKVDIEIFDYAY